MEEEVNIIIDYVNCLRTTGSFSDVIFHCVSKDLQVEAPLLCHSGVLGLLSPVLRHCLSDSGGEEPTVVISEWGREVLDLLYTGQTLVPSREKGMLVWEALSALGIEASVSLYSTAQEVQTGKGCGLQEVQAGKGCGPPLVQAGDACDTGQSLNTMYYIMEETDLTDQEQSEMMDEAAVEGSIYSLDIRTSAEGGNQTESLEYPASVTPVTQRKVPALSSGPCREETPSLRCGLCEDRFYSSVSLETHTADCHTLLPCDECESVCHGVISFIKHKGSHRPVAAPRTELEVRCELCNTPFVNNQSLKYHMYKHAGVRPYRCTVCSEAFRTPSTLKGHFLVQHSISKHKCSVCGLQSSTSGKLRIHMRSHTKEKPYPCTYCAQSFKQSCELKVHEFTHKKISDFQCDKCNKFFPIRSKFLQHRRRHGCGPDKAVNIGRNQTIISVEYLI